MRIVVLMISLLLLGACSQESGPHISRVDDCREAPQRHLSKEQKALKIAKSVDGIEGVAALFVDDNLSLAIQSSNFNMLKIELYEKQVFEKLKKEFAETNIFVTDDMKFYEKIEKMSKENWPGSKKDGCKQMKQLKKLQQNLED